MKNLRDVDSVAGSSRKRTYVALMETDAISTCTRPQDTVMLCDRLLSSAAKRSDLLAGLEQTEGLASLPGGLTPEDIRLWQTACVLNMRPPLDDLVAVLKVADALGDSEDSKWVHDLADRAAATDWRHGDCDAAMLSALCSLPEPLLLRVTARCIEAHGLPRILATFPAMLHPPAIAAAISARKGTLQVTNCECSPVLALLPYAAVPSPGLQTLDWHREDPLSHPQTAVMLARAASAHRTLTRISIFGHDLPPQWIRTFAACLAPGALPRLVNLELSCSAAPGGCAAVVVCLALLPSLTTLDITLSLADAAHAGALSSYTRLAVTPAPLPRLQQISFTEDQADETVQLPGGRSCAHFFFLLLHMPALTSLSLRSCASCFTIPDLVALYCRFPALRAVNGYVAQLTPKAGQDVFDAAAAELPPLNSLSVEANCPFALLAVAAAALAPGELTHLHLNTEHSDPSRELTNFMLANFKNELPAEMLRMWNRFLPHLGACTSLQDLSLECLVGMPKELNGLTAALGCQLQLLTQLTALALCPGAPLPGNQVCQHGTVFLEGGGFADALSHLTALRSLNIDAFLDGLIEFDDARPVVDACTRLRLLTHMKWRIKRSCMAQVVQLLRGLPLLKHLVVKEFVFEEEGVVSFDELQGQYPHVELAT